MAKKKGAFVKSLQIPKPRSIDYTIPVPKNSKDRNKLVKRLERIVRGSMEYRDYIQYLKQSVGLDSCTFLKNVGPKDGAKRISIELHHEPFTLYDYCNVVLQKYIDSGLPLNDLLMADEVLELHYANKVGLIPLSKTMHQIVHNSDKLLIPLNMVYGQYSDFLEEYDQFIDEEDMDLYHKLERKMDMTKKLTPESFEAIKKEFTYLDVEGFEDAEKMEVQSAMKIA